ncbi:MAG TPA: hypothetical protein VFE48_02785 [Methylomirabilota bacterium]|nr:hypothetical protein [Methylomirabilota bacterium]
MRPRRALPTALLPLAMAVLWPGDPLPARAVDLDWDTAQRSVGERVSDARAALPPGAEAQRLATMAERAATDPQAFADLVRASDEYVGRTLAAWKDGPERAALQEAGTQLQKGGERTVAKLRAAREAADSAAIRMRHSGVFGKLSRVEAAAKDAGARMALLWERERAMREREKEQREREAGERAREQRR